MLNIPNKPCLLFLILIHLLLYTVTAAACVLGPIPTVLDEYNGADVVMIARVVSLEKSNEPDPRYQDDVRSATMIVEKVFKGDVKVQDRIVFGQGNRIRCLWTFHDQMVGHEYLVQTKRVGETHKIGEIQILHAQA